MELNWLLPTLILMPLICGFGLLVLPSGRPAMVKWCSFVASLVILAVSIFMCCYFDWRNAGVMQFVFVKPWIEPMGININFGVDSISVCLVMLTTFIMPVTILGSFNSATVRVKEFYLWLLVLQAAMTGVFIACDLAFFYICFELTLIPLYFLIGIYGGTQKRWAANKFFIFTLSGSVFTLAGILYIAWFNTTLDSGIFVGAGMWTFDMATLYRSTPMMTGGQQGWVLLALLCGFAVKVPLFPVHTWLPLAHTEAPTSGSVILAAVLLKLGTYGLLRLALQLVPVAVIQWAPQIGVLSIIGIIYAAAICWVQQDIKKLVAYSSISHLGFCVLGMFALNVSGMSGSIMYMINHGLSTGALFLCVGMIYERYHTRDMDHLSGLGKRLPVWSTFMVFFCLASVGLPGLNGFVGEFLTIFGAFESDILGVSFAAFAATGLILGAVYILYMVGKVVMGPVREPKEYAGKVNDLNVGEIMTLAPIAAMCLALGLYPTPVLKSLEPAIGSVMMTVDQQFNHGSRLVQSDHPQYEAWLVIDATEGVAKGATEGTAKSATEGAAK